MFQNEYLYRYTPKTFSIDLYSSIFEDILLCVIVLISLLWFLRQLQPNPSSVTLDLPDLDFHDLVRTGDFSQVRADPGSFTVVLLEVELTRAIDPCSESKVFSYDDEAVVLMQTH